MIALQDTEKFHLIFKYYNPSVLHYSLHSLYFCFFLLVKLSDVEEKATKKVDDLLEMYMGIRDLELGQYLCNKPSFLVPLSCQNFNIDIF